MWVFVAICFCWGKGDVSWRKGAMQAVRGLQWFGVRRSYELRGGHITQAVSDCLVPGLPPIWGTAVVLSASLWTWGSCCWMPVQFWIRLIHDLMYIAETWVSEQSSVGLSLFFSLSSWGKGSRVCVFGTGQLGQITDFVGLPPTSLPSSLPIWAERTGFGGGVENSQTASSRGLQLMPLLHIFKCQAKSFLFSQAFDWLKNWWPFKLCMWEWSLFLFVVNVFFCFWIYILNCHVIFR